jgi:uncharacterized flavoprotein (TIGR03862 family)
MAIDLTSHKPSIAIIGGGPAGLMAAETLVRAGEVVDLFDAMPSAGRKFLVAGKGGLNITHSEPLDEFIAHYGAKSSRLEPMLRPFGPVQIREWVAELGFDTFIGTSGRVFPVTMKSAPLLRAWLTRLRSEGVRFHFRHQWLGWSENGSLVFKTPTADATFRPRAVILALGGASWPITGSTGAWVHILGDMGVSVMPLVPSNCGFEVGWSEYFSSHFSGHPLKTVSASFVDSLGRSFCQRGEFIVTDYGVEGSLIYACSALIRDELDRAGTATLHIDLAPDRTFEWLLDRLSYPQGSRSLSTHLKKTIGFLGIKASLLWEFIPEDVRKDPATITRFVKDLPIPLKSTRPLAEAISSAGGVDFASLDDRLMIKMLPGVFCAGEMLDWEAPTGGYLLTACLATGKAAGLGVLEWLREQ